MSTYTYETRDTATEYCSYVPRRFSLKYFICVRSGRFTLETQTKPEPPVHKRIPREL